MGETTARTSTGSDYLRAFHTTRRVKNLLMLLVLLCLLGQIAAYVAVGFMGMLDPVYAIEGAGEDPTARRVDFILMQAMPLTKTIGLVSAGALMLALMFAAKISLVDRLGGAAGLVGAFFWSLLLLAMVTPWQDLVNSVWAWGALTDSLSLIAAVSDVRAGWTINGPGTISRGLHYGRMLGYPGAAVLVLIIIQWRFARGYAGFGAAVGE